MISQIITRLFPKKANSLQINKHILFSKISLSLTNLSALCKETKEPVFLTKNDEGDLVVMDIGTYDQRERQLELREKLLDIEIKRLHGEKDIPAHDVTNELLSILEAN